MAFPQASRFALFLRRAFSIKETMGDVNVLQDFFPTIELLGDVIPDQRRNRGEITFISGFQAPGIAGNLTQVFFGNLPPNSISVVRHLFVAVSVADSIRLGFTTLPPTGGFNLGFVSSTDGREPGPGIVRNPLQAAFTSNPASQVQSIFFQSITLQATGLVAFMNLDVVLVDKSSDGAIRNLLLESSSAATTLQVLAIGYSRFLEPSERAA